MAKLVLDIEPEIIKQAEDFANETHSDLSVLVADFLRKMSFSNQKADEVKKIELSDWVKKLTLSDMSIPDFDHKAEYGKHLEEKYNL